MKLLARCIVLVSAAASACTGSNAARPGAPDAPAEGAVAALHHDVRVTLDPDARRLEAEDTVTLSPDLRRKLGDVVAFALHAGLAPERVGPGAPLSRAGDPAADVEREAGERAPLERFAVALAPGERTFTVRYRGTIFHPVEQRGEEHARSMAETPGIVSRDGAVLSSASGWVPQLDAGTMTFTLEARVPAGWDAVSQGARGRYERRMEATTARWECPEPQEEVLLVAGPFVERSRPAGRVLVQTFLRSHDAELSSRYLDAGEDYLAMYSALLGPYPYAKFAVVENFWETGYGMPSFTLLGPRILRFPFILHSSYPHEILHDWWGNGVFVDPSRGNWSEGLTAYLADHLVKEQRGEGAAYRRDALQRYADYVAASRDLAVREFRARHSPATEAVGYDKVAMAFHMLRRKLGDARFVAGLRAFYMQWRFRAASFDDLGRAMGGAAGEDLGPWLAQWLDRPGAPALRLADLEAGERGGSHTLALTLEQTQGGDPYAVDVPVYVTIADRPDAILHTLHLGAARQRFTVEVPGVPTRVDVDPEYDVFRRLDPAELPPTLGGAFGATQAVVVVPSAAPAELRGAYAALAESWRKGGAEVVTDQALARIPPGKAIWILGWENRLRDAVAPGVKAFGGELTPDALRGGGTALSRASHSVAVAVRSPADAGQVAAFVAAADPAALPGLARKLPHYGKYSLLGFEGDAPTNVAKATWPVPASPLAAVLGAGGPAVARGKLPPRAPLAPMPQGTKP
ncbi:MAG TPA: M1 family aminopeptidase [Anaeromyxobacteraceae bacterium]|nr:M1 family aminopeptidase [Anaeromyxobacteraceae bacterium]